MEKQIFIDIKFHNLFVKVTVFATDIFCYRIEETSREKHESDHDFPLRCCSPLSKVILVSSKQCNSHKSEYALVI